MSKTYDKRLVTICIFAKNEAGGIGRVIQHVQPYAKHVLVIDGHSTDQTARIVKRARVGYLLDTGGGRGEAVRMAMRVVKTPYIILFDADGSYEPLDIPLLLEPLIHKRADIVLASRHTGGSFDRVITLDSILRTLGSNIATLLVNKRFGTTLTDVHNGFRACKTQKVAQLPLSARDHAIEQELVIAALALGYTVVEVPSRELARGWGESKLKTYMGGKMLFDLLYALYIKSFR
jgi:dolichol-phosphate mannosyltransferase